MSRRRQCVSLAAVFLGIVIGAETSHGAAPRPNIVLILADDMGYSDLGCYGGEIETPNLDRLAEQGIRYNDFHNAARCCPTRASLLTGLYPHQAGVGHMVYSDLGVGYLGHLNDHCTTLAQVLGDAGYHTMASGKWHVGHQSEDVLPEQRGFDRFFGTYLHVDSYFKVLPGCDVYLDGEKQIHGDGDVVPTNPEDQSKEFYTTDVYTDYAVKFMEQAYQKPEPFFMYLAYNAPHWPLEAPKEVIDKYRDRYDEGWDELRRQKFQHMKQLGVIAADTELPESGNTPWIDVSESDKADLTFRRAIYAAQVDRMDQNIGRVIDSLKSADQLDETLILFLSDNGCSAEAGMYGYQFDKHRIGNYDQWRTASGRSASQGQAWANVSNVPFRKYKKDTHEGGSRTPLIAHWPSGIDPSATQSDFTGHVIDIMTTVCELSGGSLPPGCEGVSLVTTFTDPGMNPARTLYWEHEGNRAIRRDDLKLVSSRDAGQRGEWELYDLSTDPTEIHDLAAELPSRVRQLSQDWTRWAKSANVLPDMFERRQARAKSRSAAEKSNSTVPKPLFADPNYHGSCDPEVVWNRSDQQWYVYYTARRATRRTATYVGTPIGVISSPDLKSWTFRGYCSFDGKQGRTDNDDTHWAPGIVVADDQLHMFATYKASAEPPWGGDGVIRHYVAPLDDPIDGWKLLGIPGFHQPDPIDVTLIRMPDSQYRSYYRVGQGGGIQWATSDDLVTWQNRGKCPGDINSDDRGFGYQEAPYVFRFQNTYWMLTDPHDGLAVFRSQDAVTWTQQDRILKAPGSGSHDATLARHPSVAVHGGRAFIFYHVEPNRPYPTPPAEKRTVPQKKSFLQVAELKVVDGTLVCDRDAKVRID